MSHFRAVAAALSLGTQAPVIHEPALFAGGEQTERAEFQAVRSAIYEIGNRMVRETSGKTSLLVRPPECMIAFADIYEMVKKPDYVSAFPEATRVLQMYHLAGKEGKILPRVRTLMLKYEGMPTGGPLVEIVVKKTK